MDYTTTFAIAKIYMSALMYGSLLGFLVFLISFFFKKRSGRIGI